MKIRLILFITFCALIISGSLSGCSSGSFSLGEDSYYLCNIPMNYDSGVVILDHKGKTVTTFANASVDYCITEDNTILPYTAGEISADTDLVVALVSDTATETGNMDCGIWDVDAGTWKVEPVGYGQLFGIRDGLIDYLQPEDDSLNQNLPFLDYDDDRFLSIGNKKLTNQTDAEGYSYIADENGDCFLDGASFYQRNCLLGVPMTQERNIRLDNIVNDKYMVLQYDYTTLREDGTYLSSTHTYLCDTTGNILFPEWNYEWVTYAQDQFDYTDRHYLQFGNSAQEFHYFDLETETAVSLPEGWERTYYYGNNYFLNHDGNKCQIYDAKQDIPGDPFTIPETQSIFVAGPNSYILQFPESRIVIGGIEQPLKNESSIAYMTSGPYSLVTSGPFGSDNGVCYILNRDGECIYQTEQKVLYADENWYLTLDNTGYHLWNYKGREILSASVPAV